MLNVSNTDILESIYSTLIDCKLTNNYLLSDLANIVCNLFDKQSKENVYYFSMPIWDYLNNCWQENPVVRINPNNDDSYSGCDDWINERDNNFNQSRYKFFFDDAGKTFSFIEFFTQYIKTIPPIFTIKFLERNDTFYDEERSLLVCPLDIGNSCHRDNFIETTMALLPQTNHDKQKEEYNKKLDNFRVFLSKYLLCFPDLKCIYLISSRLYKQDDNRYIGSGGLILVCKELLNDGMLRFLSILTNLCYRELGGKNWAEKCRKESFKSVIAALMVRNLSHNLGSHFLTNTKNYFKDTVDKIKSDLLSVIAADYRGNTRLLQYIQERMDFIATIVSGDQYPFGGLNFKAEYFDILTNDDFGARHSMDSQDKNEKNFLLQYLLFSEHLTRKYKFDNNNSDFPIVELKVKYHGKEYTGKADNKQNELGLKNELSKLRLAVPGGVMARHALFTITENILRNSAKHNKREVNTNLVLTIELEESNGKCKLSFYDNCNSANTVMSVVNKDQNGKDVFENKTVLDVIKDKIDRITIIDEKAQVDKNDKGLKEMLFCAIWLKNRELSETLFEIQDYEMGRRYDKVKDYIEVGAKDGNLCYTITLDTWDVEKDISNCIKDGICSLLKEDFLRIHADFITAEKDGLLSIKRVDAEMDTAMKKLSDVFPRFLVSTSKDKIVDQLCGEYNIVIEYTNNPQNLPEGVFNRNSEGWRNNGKKNILFFDHLMNADRQDAWNSDEFKNSEYVDSISGENFTATIIQPELLNDKLFRYKVIESAITKIAIVDERIWENCRAANRQQGQVDDLTQKYKEVLAKSYDGKQQPLSLFIKDVEKIDINVADEIKEYKDEKLAANEDMDRLKLVEEMKAQIIQKKILQPVSRFSLLTKKNIFIYTINGDGCILDVYGDSVNKVECDFVSVHLGLLDKLPKGESVSDIITKFKSVPNTTNKRPYVSIHSGRGNFSPELDDALKDYPFVSLSALEAAFNNSKYLLSEFLFNTSYYGKGNLNNKS